MPNAHASPARAWPRSPAPHHELCAAARVWTDRTLGDFARDRAQRMPDRVVFAGLDPAPSYATLLADAEALCAAMTDLGLRPGEVVSFQTPNWAEAGVINLAAALGGFVINPIVIIYRDAEVEMMLADSRSRLIFIAESYRGFDFAAMLERLKPNLPELDYVVRVRGTGGATYEALLRAGRGRPAPAARIDPNAVKLLLYTSGTTGRPKGVLHSHNTLARAAQAAAAHWGIAENDAFLMPSPVTHVSGYSNGLELPFLAGARTVLMESWNADAAVALINAHQVVGTVAATPFLQELAAAAQRAGTDLPSLRLFACGGAAVPPDLVRTANGVFALPCAFRVFGSSEVPLVTLGYQGHANAENAAATDGQIVDYDVRIVDEHDDAVAPGAEGEILARGPAMFIGYADPAHTAESITADGFFRTGDIGCITADGALLITGRKKDLIIRGGENISAKEIEDVLHQHADVAEAAVVAAPHPRLGEGVMAFIIVRAKTASDGTAPDEAALAAFVAASGLAKQKIPEHFAFVTDFPRTASGKIRKDKLREDARRIVGTGG